MGEMPNLKSLALCRAAGYQAEVAPGVHWVRLPLPFKPEDHINVWLVAGEAGYLLVDTGLDDAITRALWNEVLAALPPPRRIVRVVVTHHHPDHCALAAWFAATQGAAVSMASREWTIARELLDDAAAATGGEAFARHGMGSGEDFVALRRAFYRSHVPALPERVDALADGDVIAWSGRAWRVYLVGGHTPAHAVLHCPEKNLLITGDHVLPDIVTNIGALAAEAGATPVSDYLASLERCDRLPEDVLVLPAHGLPFIGLRTRCAELRAVHRERIDGAWRHCAAGAPTVGELLPRLYGKELSGLAALLGFNQTKAYLDYLVAQGRVDAVPDAAGQMRFHQTTSPDQR